MDFNLTRPPLLTWLLFPTPSFVLLVYSHLLTLDDWLPILRALGCVLLKFPTVVRLGMVALAMRAFRDGISP
jgi:hypothetical protein